MSALHALDSSAAVPLIAAYHDDHDEVIRWASRRRVALAGHAVAETYSVLTRLPRPVRLKPEDAARVLATGFAPALLLKPATARRLPEILAARGIAGGAVYDALVALAAMENGCTLATRDARARGTYEVMGADVEFAGTA